MKFLFDLGGVFFDWDPNYFYENIFESEEETRYFLDNICNDEWNIKQDKGRLIKEAEDELILKYPKYTKEIKMYYKNHRKMFRGIFYKSIETLKGLKNKKYECYVLSNWSWETFNNMDTEYPFLKLFDGLIISGKEKMIKPDKEIYLLAIKKFKLNPNQTVFIDDKIENINTAKNLGFKTIHLSNPELIFDELNRYI
tara:strand:+ start:1680 stop:2270 length:591 start_codon:yes stop_codon:yes gene_type:complete